MKLRRKRHQDGSVYLDPRVNIWYLRYRDADGNRKAERIGTKKEYPTKTSAQEPLLRSEIGFSECRRKQNRKQ